jgi:hypothetical protein
MRFFDFLKKTPATKSLVSNINSPYQEGSTNLIYELLFCDNPDLYKHNVQPPYSYPFNILFSKESSAEDLQKIIDDTSLDSRIKLLAYNQQSARGYSSVKKELLAVIVEVGLDLGLDVLASFRDGTARYINQSGKILIWETTTDARANELSNDLFIKSRDIVDKIGPWGKPRLRNPPKDKTRISFLVSDGLYFGEGTTDVLFNDELAKPALMAATHLMQYLTEKSLQGNQ